MDVLAPMDGLDDAVERELEELKSQVQNALDSQVAEVTQGSPSQGPEFKAVIAFVLGTNGAPSCDFWKAISAPLARELALAHPSNYPRAMGHDSMNCQVCIKRQFSDIINPGHLSVNPDPSSPVTPVPPFQPSMSLDAVTTGSITQAVALSFF